MWDGFNQRKFPRLDLKCEIVIQSEDTAVTCSAHTENIGLGGVAVILDRPLERFSKCRISLELAANLPKIESSGRVVWAVPTRELKSKRSCYDIGIEFVNLESDQKSTLEEFLKGRSEIGI